MMNSIMKKFLYVGLIITIILSSGTAAFANDLNVSAPERISNIIKSTDENANLKSFVKNDTGFSIQNNGIEIALPKDGNKGIVIKNEGNPGILIELPNATKYKKGVMTKDGTVVYDALFQNYSVAVQAVEKNIDTFPIDEFKTSIVIENKNAPVEYTYEYNLPKNWSMMSIKDYIDTKATEEEKNELVGIKNTVFVLNQEGEIVYTVDDLQATDSQGNCIVSSYEVKGNSITQSIEISEEARYPITLYNTAHPDYKETKYLTASGIKEIRDRYTSNALENLVTGLGIWGIGLLSTPVGTVYTFISIAVNSYDQYSYATWNTFYETVCNNSNYQYLRVITRYHYHPGKRSYYPASCEYAYVSST